MKKAGTKKSSSKKATAKSNPFADRKTISSTKGKKSSGKSTAVSDKKQSKFSREVHLIILLFICLSLMLSLYFDSFGIVGKIIKGFFTGFLGSVNFVIPVFMSGAACSV